MALTRASSLDFRVIGELLEKRLRGSHISGRKNIKVAISPSLIPVFLLNTLALGVYFLGLELGCYRFLGFLSPGNVAFITLEIIFDRVMFQLMLSTSRQHFPAVKFLSVYLETCLKVLSVKIAFLHAEIRHSFCRGSAERQTTSSGSPF